MKISNKIILAVNEALSADMREMGNFLKPFDSIYYNLFLKYYKFAEEVIVKSVPASWFLKKIIVSVSCDLIISYDDSPTFSKEKPDFSKVYKKLSQYTKSNISDLDSVRKLRETLPDIVELSQKMRHYFSYSDLRIKAGVEGYQYGDKDHNVVFADLEKIVEKFLDPNEQFYLDEDEEKKEAISGGYDIEDYVIFPDGWKWILKHTNESTVEHKYGGHCGRCDNSTDEMFSLREPVHGNKWKIWATFSLDEEGYLVQRKGVDEIFDPSTGKLKDRKGNNKPSKDLHPYIYGLLKNGSDRGDIKGLTTGSGYLSENDFSLRDLPDQQREELESKLEEKDYFENIFDEFEQNGFTNNVKNTIEEELSISLGEPDGSYVNILDGINSTRFLETLTSVADGHVSWVDIEGGYPNFEDSLSSYLDENNGEDSEISFDDFRDTLDDGLDYLYFLEQMWCSSKYDREKFSEILGEDVSNYIHLEDLFENAIDAFKKFSYVVYRAMDNYDDFILGAIIKNSSGISAEMGRNGIEIISVETYTLMLIYADILNGGEMLGGRNVTSYLTSLEHILVYCILSPESKRINWDTKIVFTDLSWEDIEDTFYTDYWYRCIRPRMFGLESED